MKFNKKIVFGFLFLVLSFYLIKYSFEKECDITDIKQDILGQEVKVEMPKEIEKMICLSSDFESLFLFLLGVGFLFPSANAFVKGFSG